VGLVELIAEIMGRPVTLCHVDPALVQSVDKPGLHERPIDTTFEDQLLAKIGP
jgi:hypothetical protein